MLDTEESGLCDGALAQREGVPAPFDRADDCGSLVSSALGGGSDTLLLLERAHKVIGGLLLALVEGDVAAFVDAELHESELEVFSVPAAAAVARDAGLDAEHVRGGVEDARGNDIGELVVSNAVQSIRADREACRACDVVAASAAHYVHKLNVWEVVGVLEKGVREAAPCCYDVSGACHCCSVWV